MPTRVDSVSVTVSCRTEFADPHAYTFAADPAWPETQALLDRYREYVRLDIAANGPGNVLFL